VVRRESDVLQHPESEIDHVVVPRDAAQICHFSGSDRHERQKTPPEQHGLSGGALIKQ
jgi:hypothetical protein